VEPGASVTHVLIFFITTEAIVTSCRTDWVTDVHAPETKALQTPVEIYERYGESCSLLSSRPEDVSFCLQTAMSDVRMQTCSHAVMNLAWSYNWTCECCLCYHVFTITVNCCFPPNAPQFTPRSPNLGHIYLTRARKPLVWCHILWQTPIESDFVVCVLAKVLLGWIVTTKFRFHKYTVRGCLLHVLLPWLPK
jgi:hypothetical protein